MEKTTTRATPGKNIKAKLSSNYESITFITFYMLSLLSAPDARWLCFYIIHVSIQLTIVECEVSASSSARIKFIDSPFRYRAEDKSIVSNTVGPAIHLYALR
jgi:hypothetical protein